MKRKIVLLFIFTFFTLHNQSFAVEGTCSYHGGVNCSYGADWDGSAVCNDGWKDSSEKFYDTKECTQKLHSCSLEEFNQISSKYNLDEQRRIMSVLSDKISIISPASQDVSGQNITSSAVQRNNSDAIRTNYLEVNKIYQQYLPLSAKYNTDFNLARQECYALGEKSYYNTLAENTRKQAEIFYAAQNKVQQINEPVIIDGGYSRGTDLYCDSGYSKDSFNLRCVRDVLVAICGQNTDQQGASVMSCRCATGYKWIGGSKCQKYNIQTGELVDETPVVVQSVTKATPAINNLTSVIFTRTLKKGMSGNDVKQLQVFLQKLNYLPANFVPSVYFGDVTNNALIKFQKDNKIQPASGLFGALTQKKILLISKEKNDVVIEKSNLQTKKDVSVVNSQAPVASKMAADSIYDDNTKIDKLGNKIIITQDPNYKITNVVKARLEATNGFVSDGWFYKDTKTFMTDANLNEQAQIGQIEINKLNGR